MPKHRVPLSCKDARSWLRPLPSAIPSPRSTAVPGRSTASRPLIESHYENNYGGALRRLNAITEELESARFGEHAGLRDQRPEARGARRAQLDAAARALFREPGRRRPAAPTAMAAALARDFGSVDRWRAEFIAMGYALAGGSGWVLLTYVPRDRRLVNQYAVRAQAGRGGRHPDPRARHVRACLPHGLRRQREGLRRHLHAQHRLEARCTARYEDAAKVAPPRPLEQPEFGDLPAVGVEEVKAMLDCRQAGPDHRRPSAALHLAAAGNHGGRGVARPGARQEWVGELSKSEPVVVFCAYGFHVGCKTADRRCARPGSTRATWPAATSGGKPPKARRGSSTPRCPLPARRQGMTREAPPRPRRRAMSDLLVLSRSDLRALMRFDDYVDAVAEAFRLLARGGCQSPTPTEIPAQHGTFHIKAGALPRGAGYVAVKINGNFPLNKARHGLPTIQGAVYLADASNGRALALLDSAEITLQRTGAATAVAASATSPARTRRQRRSAAAASRAASSSRRCCMSAIFGPPSPGMKMRRPRAPSPAA